jgi:arsenate reductase
MEILIPSQLSTLGHPQRLALFRLLMRRYPDRIPAGELASTLGIKASTLSAYLSALLRAGLVVQERAGTSILYAVDLAAVQQMFGYLLNDCCRGRADTCLPSSPGMPPMTQRPYSVLFICVGNSARSIFAESILRKVGGDRFTAFSAGTRPSSELNPFAVKVLQDKGHDVSLLRAKNIAEFSGPQAPRLDFVFTVCNQSANEDCPAWDGQPVTGHWGIPDPVKAQGTEAEKALAFQRAYGTLERWIETFVALPIETLERIALQSAVDDIAASSPEIVA